MEPDALVIEVTGKTGSDDAYSEHCRDSEIEPELIARLLRENDELGNPIHYFEFGGTGNPFLHSRFDDILKLFQDRNYTLNIVGNAVNISQRLLGLNLAHGKISLFLDSPKADINDFLLGENSYHKIIESIKQLKRMGVSFDIMSRLGSFNYKDIEHLALMARGFGADGFIPMEVFPVGKAIKNAYLLLDESAKSAVSLKIERLHLFRPIHFAEPLVENNCTYLRFKRLFINADGFMSFCHFLSSMKGTEMVDVRNHSLKDLFEINNQARETFLREKSARFGSWPHHRMASPCGYCVHAFGGGWP